MTDMLIIHRKTQPLEFNEEDLKLNLGDGWLAQVVRAQTHNTKVAGSIPI